MSFFAIGIEHPKTQENVGTLWRTAYCFGAAYVFTIGRRYKRQASDTVHAARQIPCFHYTSIEDMMQHLPLGCRVVGVELTPDAMPLPAFTHPTPACYLLGAEDHGLSQAALRRCATVVQIPWARQCLNVATAGALVLYDYTTKQVNKINNAAV